VFGEIDIVERKLYSPCKYLDLKVHVKLSNRSESDRNGAKGIRLAIALFKRFTSNRYVDRDSLVRLEITPQEYLVFSYSKGHGTDWQREEVFVSYPHIHRIVETFRMCTEKVFEEGTFYQGTGEDEDKLYLTEAGEEYFKAEDLAGEKSILLCPIVTTDWDGNEEAGARIFINSMDNYTDIGWGALESLSNFLSKFDLLQNSNTLLTLAAVAESSGNVPLPKSAISEFTPASLPRKTPKMKEMETDA
jgi:hypothetical protein